MDILESVIMLVKPNELLVKPTTNCNDKLERQIACQTKRISE